MKNRKKLKLVPYFFVILSLIISHRTAANGLASDTLSIFKLKKYEATKARAEKYYNDFAYVKGITVYKKVLGLQPNDDTVKLQIAKGYYLTHELDSAEQWYSQVIHIEPVVSDETHYLNYAEILASNGEYQEAKTWFEKFASRHPNDHRVRERLIGLDHILKFYKDSLRFDVSHVPFNSDTYDFSPSYFEDELLFVSGRETAKGIQFLKPKYKWDKTYFLNLFRVDTLEQPEVFNKRIKSSYHEGPVTFYDNDTKVIFTRNNFTKGELRFKKSKLKVQGAQVNESQEGINKLKLFYAEKEDHGGWSTPVGLWFNSNEFSTGHPTVSKDGQRLYFASDRDGSKGKTDLYKCTWYNGVWGEPENLGDLINTEASEMFPFVDENEVLYFASDGHEGLGGLDIFRVDLKKEGDLPENMGYPMNSPKDDFGVILKNTELGQSGYFSSNRDGGLGLDDIYAFNLEKKRALPGKVVDLLTGQPITEAQVVVVNAASETLGQIVTGRNGLFDFSYDWSDQYQARASKANFTKDSLLFSPSELNAGDTVILRITKELLLIKGTITDMVKGDTLDAVRIIVTNENSGEKFGMKTSADGAYSFIGKPNTVYTFDMKKHRYFSETSQVNTEGKFSGEIIHDEKLEEIVIGKPIELDDIHFDLAKWNIRPDAAEELDKFTKQLEDNPSIIVELSTHTDSRGSDSYNLDLSDKRAKSSAEYVIDHGIARERLVGKGYGETKLLNKCDDGVKCSAAEHQRNRRAEFKVTGFLPAKESAEEQGLLWISADYISANMSDPSQIVLVDEGSKGRVDLSGRVVDQDGNPIEGAFITARQAGGKGATQIYTDMQGNFQLKGNQNSTYRIVAQQKGYTEEGIKIETTQTAKSGLEIILTKEKEENQQ